jgi:hypothetical protein
MRMKLSCTTRGLRVWIAVVTQATTFFSANAALAQNGSYVNSYQAAYRPQPSYQQPHQAYQPQYNAGQMGNVGYQSNRSFMPGPQVQQPGYQPMQNAQAQYPQTQYASPQQYAPRPQQYQPQQYQPQYVAMAHQPAPTNSVPAIPQPMETLATGPAMQQPGTGYAPQGGPTTPTADYSQGNMGGYENYSAGTGAAAGCENYGSYCQPNYCDGNVGYGCCDTSCCAPRRHWFGGVYGLFMERVDCGNGPIAYETMDYTPGHYPTSDQVVMNYGDLDGDLQPGFEVRFGATFACCGGPGGYGGCCDPCGSSCCGGTLGWEVGYWQINEESTSAYVDVMPGDYMYTMKRFDRLQYYYEGVWRPVNHFFAYGVPTQDYWTDWGDIAPQVTSVYTRSSFDAQNVEWNLVCLPTISGGSCGPACDSCAGGGCDSCAGGSCGAGGCCRLGGRCGAYCYCGPRWQCSSQVGVRYFRFDDDYMFQAEGEMYDYMPPMPTPTGDMYSLAYYNSVENQLVGFQYGGSGCYHLGCCGRVALHFGANAGIYGNYIEMNQWFSGQVRDAGTGTDYNVTAEDDNIAFLGELRLGASYQCTCNCRVYGGYRALGVTGVALNYNQYASPTDQPYINCDGSLFLHGIQTGVEFMY